MFEKWANRFSGLCIGYAVSHVIVFYFVITLILQTAGLKFLNKMETGLGAEQVLVIIAIGYVLPRAASPDGKSAPTPELWIYIGAAMYFSVAVLKLIG